MLIISLSACETLDHVKNITVNISFNLDCLAKPEHQLNENAAEII